MPQFVPPLLAALATALGLAGLWTGVEPMASHATWLLALGALALLVQAPTAGFLRSGASWPRTSREPRPLRLGPGAWARVPIMWLHAFRRSYAVEPGLYYTGAAWDPQAPLLVTGNYLLSVLAVMRGLGDRSAGLLVVDSDGINVWCASGKGRFSVELILLELDRYDPALLGDKPRLILPKLGLSGVKLKPLRAMGLNPVVGPVHARDLPAFLDADRPRHQRHARLVFGWRARLFAWLPGLVQLLGYGLATLLGLLAVEAMGGPEVPLGLLALVAWLGTAYPLLFPWIPGRRFAVKGLWLGGASGAAIAALGLLSGWPVALALSTALFSLGMAVFVGLSFTGNSAVSNYSEVRKEIARFLPLDAALFLAALITFLLAGSPA
jgi:hypothetical protein